MAAEISSASNVYTTALTPSTRFEHFPSTAVSLYLRLVLSFVCPGRNFECVKCLHHRLDTVNMIRTPPFDRRIAVSPVSALSRVSGPKFRLRQMFNTNVLTPSTRFEHFPSTAVSLYLQLVLSFVCRSVSLTLLQ